MGLKNTKRIFLYPFLSVSPRPPSVPFLILLETGLVILPWNSTYMFIRFEKLESQNQDLLGPQAHQERMIQICNICTFQSILQKYATTMKMMPPSQCPQARRKCWIRGSRNFVQFLSRLEMREMQTGMIDQWRQPFGNCRFFIGIS